MYNRRRPERVIALRVVPHRPGDPNWHAADSALPGESDPDVSFHSGGDTVADIPEIAGRRVLVVEDESMVCMMIEDWLATLGLEVVGAASGLEDAVQNAETLDFDIAVLDVNLEGRWSNPVADVLIRRRLPFIVATGYGVDALPGSLRGVPSLQKPFRQEDLERALRAALRPGG